MTIFIIIYLLLLLVFIEGLRLFLQYKQAKNFLRAQENTYCAPSKVENRYVKVYEEDLSDKLYHYASIGMEVVSICYAGFDITAKKRTYLLLFTHKQIKNYNISV